MNLAMALALLLLLSLSLPLSLEANVCGLDMGMEEGVHWCVSITISPEYPQEDF